MQVYYYRTIINYVYCACHTTIAKSYKYHTSYIFVPVLHYYCPPWSSRYKHAARAGVPGHRQHPSRFKWHPHPRAYNNNTNTINDIVRSSIINHSSNNSSNNKILITITITILLLLLLLIIIIMGCTLCANRGIADAMFDDGIERAYVIHKRVYMHYCKLHTCHNVCMIRMVYVSSSRANMNYNSIQRSAAYPPFRPTRSHLAQERTVSDACYLRPIPILRYCMLRSWIQTIYYTWDPFQ